MKYTCSLEIVQQNGRFTPISSKFPYSILFDWNTTTFLTLSVRNGHILGGWVFRIPAHIEIKKVDSKNYNQHSIKHDKDNNSQNISWNQNHKNFILKQNRFQDNVRFSIFEHILNLNHCCVFERKHAFPNLSI